MTTNPDMQTKLDLIAERVMGSKRFLYDDPMGDRYIFDNGAIFTKYDPETPDNCLVAHNLYHEHVLDWRPDMTNDHSTMLERRLVELCSILWTSVERMPWFYRVIISNEDNSMQVKVCNPDPIAACRLALVEAAYKLAQQMGESEKGNDDDRE